MDIDFDGLISSDAANPAKGGIKFQPKGKPKPNAQPEPKPTPTPSTQSVEVAASTAEQTRNDVTQIIENIGDSLQSSGEKSQEENTEPVVTLGSSNDFLPKSTITTTGPRVSKFKPKPNPKAQNRKLQQISNNPDPDVGPVQHGENIHSVPFQTDFIENEPALSFQTETISDYHVNEDSISLTELSQMHSVNETGRSSKRSRRLASKVLQTIDEAENEDIDDFVPENESLVDRIESKSKSKSKAKKPLDENKKPVRKRKKDKEVSGELTEVPKKKFSHSTKRNKRPVNPELLSIPEEEFELHMHNFPLRDLIRLREHKERIEKKEASLSGANATDESESAQNTTYYNYRTHMKITPRMKWTKQDTELFYEAIQQFGLDFSIITECFPGRTHKQIISKFKKEDKQHRLRIESAPNTRAKGLSRFEYVLERLKQARAEDSENGTNDDPTGEEDEVQEAADNNEEGELQKDIKEDMEADESLIKADDIEDEDTWNQYTGEI